VPLAGLGLLYVPTWHDLLAGRWSADAQGHELMILAVSLWLIARERAALVELAWRLEGRPWAAAGWLAAGLLMYVLGRSQQFLRLELLSQVVVAAGLLLGLGGWAALRRCWFALFFLLFVIPLPYSVVLAITGPMKQAVSAIAAWMLYQVGYPVGRSGVVVTVGQYQLLVAEACAGLHTMFTLEALGLLYTKLMNYRSAVRNVLLAVLVVPTAFAANVVRVLILMLVTFHFGDEVGQGFVHGAAGLLLFAIALVLILGLDGLLGRVLPARWRQ
jgi:exosortase B